MAITPEKDFSDNFFRDKSYANMTIPGNVQSYMAVGKSVIGAINGSCANFIMNNEAGYIYVHKWMVKH